VSQQRILVLGAGAAGLKAAARARRLLPAAAITVIDRSDLVGYGACGLPYVLSGELSSLDDLRRTSYGTLRDAAWFAATRDIEVLTGCEVVAIDRDKRAVTVQRESDGARTMHMYDQLVYALGSDPVVPDGVVLGGAVCLGNAPAAVADLRCGLEQGQITSALVLGGGLVGLEAAAAMADLWGCEVTVLEAADRLLPRALDADMARLVDAHLSRRGLAVRLNARVVGASEQDGHAVVTLEGGERLTADRAIVALGSTPCTALARAAGLALGDQGCLIVDANLRTSDPDILAAGDCIALVHHVTGELLHLPMGSLASRQGRVVGDVLAGLPSGFPAVVGSVAVRLLDLNVAATGLSEAAAAAAGLDVAVAWGAFDDRSGFHPDRQRIYLKVVHEAGCGRLVGLQAVGAGDVAKRVDVFAGLLRQDATLQDVLDVEWCYAPPFNAALDPLHGLAAAALNTCGNAVRQQPPLCSLAGLEVVDVRTADEFNALDPAAVPGSLNIPLEELRHRLDELPPGDVVVVCAKGPRSVEAARVVAERQGRAVRYLAGGVDLDGFAS
jgi:NADPH-dependent 2,4-dienoyl-CoA reductase/sulfur reductase-like enzyme/rhodanese-related sulfurtransferase